MRENGARRGFFS